MMRQETGDFQLNGYFYEKGKDGRVPQYRLECRTGDGVAPCLRARHSQRMADLTKRTGSAVKRYIENYILKDAASNPFSVTPYGVFVKPLHSDEVTFRDAGGGQFRPHVHQSAQCAGDGARHRRRSYASRLPPGAGRLPVEKRSLTATRARRLIQWATGHNTTGLCLFTGVGFRHPVIASFVNYRIPDATMDGFVGRLDDTPYMETSNAVEWNTQEVWGVPFYYAIGAVTYLSLVEHAH